MGLCVFGLYGLEKSAVSQAVESADSMHYESSAMNSNETDLKRQASVWQLTEAQYQRYLELMEHGRARYFWRDLDPVMVLGLSAETEQERQAYAELYVQVMRDRVTRELAWERAYQAADKKLYPDQQTVIDPRRLWGAAKRPGLDSETGQAEQLWAGDHLFVIVDQACLSCVSQVKNLMQSVAQNHEITADLYVVGPQTNQQLLAFAQSAGLPKAPFKAKRATLNLGDTEKAQLSDQQKLKIVIERGGHLLEARLPYFR